MYTPKVRRGVFMDISSVDANALNAMAEAQNFEMQYAAKLFQMIQGSTEVAGSIIQDAVEISQEAMDRFLSER